MKRSATSLPFAFMARTYVSNCNRHFLLYQLKNKNHCIRHYRCCGQQQQQYKRKTILQHISYHPSSQRRWYFTPVIEPNNLTPINDTDVQLDEDSAFIPKQPQTVVERPCSIVLAEEFITLPPLGYESSKQKAASSKKVYKSWHKAFSQVFPKLYGISYTKWSVTDPNEYDPSISIDPDSYTTMTFDKAITIMKDDLRTIQTKISPNIVLVTRGPVLSWMAQFYLESLPLSGLVMIDPIPFVDQKAYDLYYDYYNTLQDGIKNNDTTSDVVLQRDYKDILEDYGNHWDHWTLKIEPGSIPMMVLSTMVSNSIMKNQLIDNENVTKMMDDDDDGMMFNTTTEIPNDDDVQSIYMWRQYAELTAQRHNTGGTKPSIPILDVDSNHIVQCSSIIHDWMNDQVL